MSLWDSVTRALALEPWNHEPVQERSDVSSLEDLLSRISGTRTRPWTPATVREALAVPAIYAAVSIISNAVGSLTMRAFRNGTEMADADRPRIVVRPNPFSTSRDFFRDTAYSMATRGEAWWWVAARDTDQTALSVIPVNPAEVIVTEDDRDLRFPKIEWRGRRMPNADMVQLTLLREPGSLRGHGPLQMCGAAVSVAVESAQWAANFYAEGGKGGTIIKSARELGILPEGWSADAYQHEADALRAAWVAKANNLVRVIDPNIESIEEHEPSEAGAQMLQARSYSAVEAAQMFNMPAPMIEAAVAGGSLTYQNIPSLSDSLVRRCLRPNYFEPIEQAMSDLLTRSTTARFNTDALLQDSIDKRAEVYAKLVPIGVMSVEEAQRREGIIGGDIENAPVPFALPQAIPASLPSERSAMRDVRHDRCGHLLGRVSGAAELFCRWCKETVPVAA